MIMRKQFQNVKIQLGRVAAKNMCCVKDIA